MPVNAALACGFQYGAASPASAGTNVTPPVSIDGRAEAIEVRRLRHDPHVDQPRDGSADRVHLAVEAVRQVVADPPGGATDQSVARSRRLVAGAGQHERTGAVRALGLAARAAVLGEQCGLLIDARACHGNRRRRTVARRRAARCCRRPWAASTGRYRRSRTPRSLHRPVSRSSSNDRPAVATSVANAPHRRCSIHASVVVIVAPRRRAARAATPSSARRSTGRARGRCGRRETSAVLAKSIADDLRTTVLPHDRRTGGSAGRAIPRQHRLALVGQPDRRERRMAGAGHRLVAGGDDAGPQLLRIELDRAVRSCRERGSKPRRAPAPRRRRRRPPPWWPRCPDRSPTRSRRRHYYGAVEVPSTVAVDGVHGLSRRGDPVLRRADRATTAEPIGWPTSRCSNAAVKAPMVALLDELADLRPVSRLPAEQGCPLLEGQDAVQGSHRRVRRVGGRRRFLRAVLGDRDGCRVRLLPHGR